LLTAVAGRALGRVFDLQLELEKLAAQAVARRASQVQDEPTARRRDGAG
jgi:hypothetical protein